MTDRTTRIEELKKNRVAIDVELKTLKKAMTDEVKLAFAVPKKPRKPRQIKLEAVK